MNALYLLEQMQKNNVDIEAFEFNKNNPYAEVIERIKIPEMPTKYQDRVCYCAFKDAFEVLFSVLPHFKERWKEKWDINDIARENIKFGTISNPKFNSASYKVNESEYLIVINEGVLSFLNEMSTLMVEFLFTDDLISYETLVHNLKLKPHIVKEFIIKMLAYYFFYHTWQGQKKKIRKSDLFWRIRDAVAFESRVFVCAHELGHILLGHLETENEIWEREFQADRFAALIMFGELNIHPVFLSAASAMMLGILECIDRMNGKFLVKHKSQHPLSYVRANKVGGIAFRILGYEASNPFQLTRMLINILWDEFMDFTLYLTIEKKIDLNKDRFGEMQAILEQEYVLPERDYEEYFDSWLGSGYSIVRGFYNSEQIMEGDIL